MKTPAITALLLIGSLAAVGAHADEGPLSPFQAEYSLYRNSLGLGVSDFSLSKDAGGYTYKSVSHATGLASLFSSDVITQASSFTLVDGRPRSQSYSYQQTGKDQKSETIQFDWEGKTAHTDEDGHSRKNPLTPDASDVLLIQLILAVDGAAGKPADGYKLLDHGEIASYAAKALPDAKLKLGSASYDTQVLELRDATKGRVITVWLSPALHYLPVQIQQAQQGKATITLTLDSASFGDAAPKK